MNDITAAQIRAARALLGISANVLAHNAAVGIATVRRAESDMGTRSITRANLAAIRRALEDQGVVFLDEGTAQHEGPGVRLRKDMLEQERARHAAAMDELLGDLKGATPAEIVEHIVKASKRKKD
ncbi:hypothetical protein [Azospirillum argentinense]|uniref:hypothetical protein n=1 Tax=Azospirillum argentinense TaxID=2970906 RepID=UPI0032E0578C